MTSSLDHVALLTQSIERSCTALGVSPDNIEEFPAEGTRELYLGAPGGARLLLMQAIGPGPYQDALSKRGPGLHHVALCVEHTRAFAAASGWLVHPRFLDQPDRMLWLAHPAVPCLVELMAGPPLSGDPIRLGLPGRPALVSGLRCDSIQHDDQPRLSWSGDTYPIAQLV